MDAQFVLLGSGPKYYEDIFRDLIQLYPYKIGAYFAYSEEIAHQIEAGADIFLMPSQYEPCGLNQIYSLKYGTVPVVRKPVDLQILFKIGMNIMNLVNRLETDFHFMNILQTH